MEKICKEIIEKYISHLKNSFIVEDNDFGCSIFTPFQSYSLENIRFYVEPISENGLRLTDLGNTIRHLETININTETMKVSQITSDIEKMFNIKIIEKSIIKDTKIENLGESVINYLNALQMFSDIEYLSTPARARSFSEQVHLYCIEKKLKHNWRKQIKIRNIPYKIDIIDKKVKNLIQTNGVSTDETSEMLRNTQVKTYPFIEIELGKIENYYRIVLYDDGLHWSSNSIALMENHSDDLIKWKEKKKLHALLES